MQPPPEKKPRKQFKPKPVAELQSFYTQAKIKPPPDVIKDPQVFDWSCDFWMSFDVETHDLAPKTDKKGWVQGEFGHKVRPQDTTEVRNLRVVQLGWTVGSFKPDMVPVTKVRCVKPVGFNIALAAEAIHKLSTEYVTMNGLDLKSVLEEFMCDMMSTMGKSGRLCAHHFEFDAAILDAEMCRLGMAVETRYNWAMAARGGFCTMNPHLTHWCCEEYIRERVSFLSPDLLITVPLAQLVRVLSPLEQEMCEPAHDAGSDSCAVWLALRQLEVSFAFTRWLIVQRIAGGGPKASRSLFGRYLAAMCMFAYARLCWHCVKLCAYSIYFANSKWWMKYLLSIVQLDCAAKKSGLITSRRLQEASGLRKGTYVAPGWISGSRVVKTRVSLTAC